jgi:hypothetical protein
LSFNFSLLETGFLLIGFLYGNQLENTPRIYYKNWKNILKIIIFLGIGNIVSYSLDEIFGFSSFSFLALWIGILMGFFITRTYKELRRSRLELLRGFAKAGTSKN